MTANKNSIEGKLVACPNKCFKLCVRGKNLLRNETFNFPISRQVNDSCPSVDMPRLSMVTKRGSCEHIKD